MHKSPQSGIIELFVGQTRGTAMQKLLSWLLGIGLGALMGALLVIFFAPASGPEITRHLKHSWTATLDDARRASAERRAELEAELARRQNRSLPE
jgi:gas vesicle protein